MKRIHVSLALLLVSLLAAGAAPAQGTAPEPASEHPGHSAPTDATPTAWSEGEIVRLDTVTGRVTLRHGEIANLGMPSMTMVFRVQDTALLEPFKTGDKVRFQAEKRHGLHIVTQMEAAR